MAVFPMPKDAHAQTMQDTATLAAREFADRVATRGTEAHSRAFQGALDLAMQVNRVKEKPRDRFDGRSESSTIRNKGDLNADPRYNANIAAMLSGPSTKIW